MEHCSDVNVCILFVYCNTSFIVPIMSFQKHGCLCKLVIAFSFCNKPVYTRPVKREIAVSEITL